jgi:menaquinone-specific isochorismate synthase
MRLVERAVGAIEAGRFAKVVVAREVVATANRVIHVPTVLRRLRSLYPACTVVGAPLGVGDRHFVAASPEILVARDGANVRSHPLAGTIPRSGDPHSDQALADSLLASPKDRAEHEWVVRDVVDGLRPWCESLEVPPTPSIVSLRNVSHLGTLVSGTLTEGAPSALGLAAALHPTAAVGGTPRAAALAWLTANERLDRGPYAGPVGWVDARGDGEWVVGIRSAVISGASARLFAGVGVVDGSDPAAELAETQFKLQALLAAVVRP